MIPSPFRFFAALVWAPLLCLSAWAAEPSGYAVVQRIPSGAATKWDYAAIDVERQRLYITRGDHIDVLQLPAADKLGSIERTTGVHGVAFAPELKLGFSSNGKDNSVTVFNLETLQQNARIPVTGENPDAILYDSGSRKVFVFNGHSASVDVIGVDSLEVIATVHASGRPEFAVSDGRGKIYFNIEDHAGINVIDTASDKIVATWLLDGCEEPSGLALDRKNSRLFSSCQNGFMAVTDANSGKRVAQFPIGEHPDAVVFDPDTSTIFTSGGGGTGTLTITHQLDGDHYEDRGNVTTEKGARTMAMNPKDKTVYLPTVVGDKFVVLVVGRKP